MKAIEVLQNVYKVRIPVKGYPVERTVAEDIIKFFDMDIDIQPVEQPDMKSETGVFNISVATEELKEMVFKQSSKLPYGKEWVYFSIDENNCCWFISSKPYFLYAAFSYVKEKLMEYEVSYLKNWMREISFPLMKSTFDLFLTQYARNIRSFNREQYIREYARLGFTHIEVNALAALFPCEEGVPGEFYPDFYTYCPALDQFVASRLNQGIYPKEYLQKNMALLKENARITVRYGLVPGLICFEPRSVPEDFFKRYPTLRGARVDHPFRSFKPRFNLSLAHPVVQKHYAELITNLLKEVPELEFLTVWTNDSGAGFEHTKSLYVGRNGGAYLIREWKDDDEIAQAAAVNIINFFRLLRDAASKVNSHFRIIARLEPFYGERKYLWPELGDRIDVEANSFLSKGWESNYPHPRYEDIKVSGSAYQNKVLDKEKGPIEELHSRKSRAFLTNSFNTYSNHEPLLGIPFPWLTHEKLCASWNAGILNMSHQGGLQPPEKVPYAVNQEIFCLFQFNPDMDIDREILAVAERYVGEHDAGDMVKGWQLTEEAIRSFMPLSIYTHYGVVWQRLFVRPLVPDIDRIPEEERAYYEKFMCSSIHNPNRVDLARDVLFELVSKDYAYRVFNLIDENVWGPINAALSLFKIKMEEAGRYKKHRVLRVFKDQHFRIRALKSLFETLRNTAVWIYAVHEYLDTQDLSEKASCRKLLDEMIDREIQNCKELIRLWKESSVEWMIVAKTSETPFIYGDNFPELLERKMNLMEKHRHDEPYIDPDYMFRVTDNPYG